MMGARLGTVGRIVAAISTGGLSEIGGFLLDQTKAEPAAAPPPVPDTLDADSIEQAQAGAERRELRKRAAALSRAQTNFTSSLGAPRPGNTIKTALGGFS